MAAAFLLRAFAYGVRALFCLDNRHFFLRKIREPRQTDPQRVGTAMGLRDLRVRNPFEITEFVCDMFPFRTSDGVASDAVMDRRRAIYTVTSQCVRYPDTTHTSIGVSFALDIA